MSGTATKNPRHLDAQQKIELYRAMLTAREIDRVEQELTRRGEAFFQLSGSGHEGVVAIAPHLIADDWLHCHYRDRALLIARGITPHTMLAGFFCKQDSVSRGRRMSPS